MEEAPKNPLQELRSSLVTRGGRLETALGGKKERMEYSASDAELQEIEDLRLEVTDVYQAASMAVDLQELEALSEEFSRLEEKANTLLKEEN